MILHIPFLYLLFNSTWCAVWSFKKSSKRRQGRGVMKIETFEIKEGNMAFLKPSAELYWKAQRRPFLVGKGEMCRVIFICPDWQIILRLLKSNFKFFHSSYGVAQNHSLNDRPFFLKLLSFMLELLKGKKTPFYSKNQWRSRLPKKI